jgi:predicted nicotinamide N-methyase
MQQFSDPENKALNLGISSSLWPIFGKVWPMSNVLAKIMLTEPLEDRSILEVGCGLALPSLILQKLGKNITSSDYHPLAKLFLLQNAKLNFLKEIPFQTGNWNISLLKPKKYDLIIGSDLLYQANYVQLLSSFVNNNLTRQGEIIIVDPGRGLHRKFAQAMKYLGFESTWTDLKLFPHNGVRQNGFIFRFTRTKI